MIKRVSTRWTKDEAARAMRVSHLIFKGPAFDIRLAPQSSSVARVLIVTPRKSGNAVKRNLFRRRSRALFAKLALTEGAYDWLIFAKNISDLSFDALHKIFITTSSGLSAPSAGMER